MAGIIKSGVWQNAGGCATVAFNFQDMTTQAEAYLETVRQQARQILQQAKEQVSAIEASARERGREAAVQQAVQTAQAHLDQRLQTLVPALEKAVVDIQQSRATWLRHWEQNTLRLATEISERLIRRELTVQPDITLEWIHEALELVTGEGRVTLQLHPDDHETLGERAEKLIARLTKLGSATIVSDPTVERGGCRVVTDFGSVDLQLSTQLQRIRDELGA